MLKRGVGEVWMFGVLAFWTGVVAWSLFREEPTRKVWRWDPGTGWQINGVRLERGAFGIRIDDYQPQAAYHMEQERTFDPR
jgi:hypothetical protein